jgi:hypothetical protein
VTYADPVAGPRDARVVSWHRMGGHVWWAGIRMDREAEDGTTIVSERIVPSGELEPVGC